MLSIPSCPIGCYYLLPLLTAFLFATETPPSPSVPTVGAVWLLPRLPLLLTPTRLPPLLEKMTTVPPLRRRLTPLPRETKLARQTLVGIPRRLLFTPSSPSTVPSKVRAPTVRLPLPLLKLRISIRPLGTAGRAGRRTRIGKPRQHPSQLPVFEVNEVVVYL